jgi:hypothetical protein
MKQYKLPLLKTCEKKTHSWFNHLRCCGMQALQAECIAASAIQSVFGRSENPRWVLESYDPIRIGGTLGFVLAYILGLYTLLHVAGAYKRFAKEVSPSFMLMPNATRPFSELQCKAARLHSLVCSV